MLNTSNAKRKTAASVDPYALSRNTGKNVYIKPITWTVKLIKSTSHNPNSQYDLRAKPKCVASRHKDENSLNPVGLPPTVYLYVYSKLYSNTLLYQLRITRNAGYNHKVNRASQHTNLNDALDTPICVPPKHNWRNLVKMKSTRLKQNNLCSLDCSADYVKHLLPQRKRMLTCNGKYVNPLLRNILKFSKKRT